MSTSAPPMQQIKTAMKTTWMAGDFGMIAKTISKDATKFIDSLPIAVGARVLDVATGTGNLALPLALKGMSVTGVDIATNLLEKARERATEAGLNITFDEGDAEQLPYPDQSFDAAVTMFGAMFAPRPELVASEFARVLKPGGLLAMANWNPEGFTGRMFRTTSKHVPPPPGVLPPVLWGDDKTVRERLDPFFTDIQTELIPLDFDMPFGPEAVVAFYRTYYGPTQMAFNRLDEAGQTALAADLQAMWANENAADDVDNHTLVRNSYLKVTAKRR